MKKKHFLYLSLTSLFFSTQAYKAEASMREICNDLITNNVIQRASSAYSYVASNSSRINFTDVDLYNLCDNIMTPIRNITIEQMPALRINTSNIYENINAAANLSIVTIGIITIGATIYFGYKQHKDGDLIPNKLAAISLNLTTINTNLITKLDAIILHNSTMAGNSTTMANNSDSTSTAATNFVKNYIARQN